MIVKTENKYDYNVKILRLGEKVTLGLVSQKEFSVSLTQAEAKRIAYALLLRLRADAGLATAGVAGRGSRSEAPDDGERLCPSVGTQIRPLMDT